MNAMSRRVLVVSGLIVLIEPMLSRANTPSNQWLAVLEGTVGAWLVAFGVVRGG